MNLYAEIRQISSELLMKIEIKDLLVAEQVFCQFAGENQLEKILE
jgi:hypothetical protein